MSPRALLFSSDEGTSRLLALALQELDLEVESCPEIFAAVEKLTLGNIAVVIADWDMGPEASFLLQSAREMQSTVTAFRVALTGNSEAAARQVGAQLILNKPALPHVVRSVLMSSNEFLSRMQQWVRKDVPSDPPPIAIPRLAPPARKETPPSEETLPTAAEPMQGLEKRETAERGSRIETLFEKELRAETRLLLDSPSPLPVRTTPKPRPVTIVRRITLGIAFAASLYVSISPARSAGVVVSVTTAYERALQKTQTWLRRSDLADTMDEAEIAQDMNLVRPLPERRPARIRVTPAPDPYAARPVTPSVAPNMVPEPAPKSEPVRKEAPEPSPTTIAHIPESMRTPFGEASVREVALKSTPSLINAMEPVSLSEDIAQQLLVEKTVPSYPEQAIKSGLRGPVVLQAWIGKDGRIEDLKLVRGYLILGQAATQAVRLWKFRPYLQNGRPVQAQTLLTVDFKMQ